MFHMNKKVKQVVSGIIVAPLILAMIIPTIAYFL